MRSMQSQWSGVLHALRDGARRVNAAPAVGGGMWALTIAAALQAQYVLGIGDVGLAAEWVQELVGPAAAPIAFARHNVPSGLTAAAAATPIAAWLFLTGGIIDRYARDRATRAYGFFAACGVFFFRFLRLAVIEALVYAAMIAWVHPAVALTALAAIANVIFDYAKVRAVVEDRRSMIGALGAALGFTKRNAVAAAALYIVDFAILAAVVAVFRTAAPGGTAGPWGAAATAAAYVAARLWVKLLFWASETALFQSRLAHAGYVARPEAVWPDAPIVEGLR